MAVEIFLMYVCYFLNIPGIFEQTGSIIIMIIGILCCLGAVCGSVVVDNRIDDRLERGHVRILLKRCLKAGPTLVFCKHITDPEKLILKN